MIDATPGRDGSAAADGSGAHDATDSLCRGRGTLRGVSPGLFLALPLGVPDMAKKTRSRREPVEHEGTAPAEERTGDVVPDVRVTHRDHPNGRTVRVALRRGGTPVALTPDEADALASQLQDVAAEGR